MLEAKIPTIASDKKRRKGTMILFNGSISLMQGATVLKLLLPLCFVTTAFANEPTRYSSPLVVQHEAPQAEYEVYKAIDIPQALFAIDGEVWNEPMSFAVGLIVDFTGRIRKATITPNTELSLVERPDTVWKSCVDSIRSAIEQWRYYGMTSVNNQGPITRGYIEEYVETCDGETTLPELLDPGNQSAFKFRIYLMVVIKPNSCSVSFSRSIITAAK